MLIESNCPYCGHDIALDEHEPFTLCDGCGIRIEVEEALMTRDETPDLVDEFTLMWGEGEL